MRSQIQKAETGRAVRRRFRLLKRVLMCLLVAAMWTAPVSSAHALDKNQIIQMSKLGMETNAIKGAIDGAGSELKLSPEEVGELRAAGVDEEVIKYLEATGHVEGGDEADGGEEAPAPADDEASGPAPAPAPGEEEESKEYTEEELEKLAEEKAKEINEEKKAEEARQRKIQAEARKLPQAKRAVESGDNMSAAKTYLKFLSLNPDPEGDDFYAAKFGLAKALYQEGILSGAANPLLDVIMAGAQRPHFKEAFYMLEELTKRIGFQPPLLEEMTKFYVGDMNAKFKNDFHYYLGKFFFDYGRGDLAIEYLDKVEKGAADYPEALYLKGVAQLEQQKQGEALKNFERAIVAGEQEPGGNEEILQLGYMALARVFYEVGYYDVALYYYQKIPSKSARNASATFETAWTYFMKNDYKRALGTFHTLHSPYYSEWYFPDLYILESAVYLNLCQFDKSKEALAKFQQTYLDKRPVLEKFLQETTEPKAYWTALTGIYQKDKPKAARNLPPMFANAVLDELEFYNVYGVIQTLKKERDALKQNVSALGEFGQQVLGSVESQLDTKIEEGGILVQQKLSEVNKELQDWDLKATQISFDIGSEEEAQLERRLRNQSVEEEGVEQGTTLLIVADDFTPWPFEGEYWADEVTNYRSRLRSSCSAE
ncbi:tetratricopeptide repeat protein [Persicimonas caeni]|nr:tetratricopeptide repeat protein [Persicimonas caeni]